MRILVLPNALKGSLSARRAGEAIVRALTPRHRVKMFPICDGGDGFLDFFRALDSDAKTYFVTAKNAFLKPKRVPFLLLSDKKTAIIETAKICGLGSAKKEELDPLGASSYGVGQVLLKAVKRGAKTIYVGLGGVATNDGGAGMAVACGARLLTKTGHEIPLGAQALQQVEQLDLSALKKQFQGIQIIGIADVKNPLLGPLGSARVFGPQKGATTQQVEILERALTVWARVLQRETNHVIARVPSTGAAGAIAAGLYGCFGATLSLGTRELFKKVHLDKLIQKADLMITAEGKLDEQTFYGKAPGEVVKLANKYHKPILFICGQVDQKIFKRKDLPNLQIAALLDFAQDEQDAKKHATKYLSRVCKNLYD